LQLHRGKLQSRIRRVNLIGQNGNSNCVNGSNSTLPHKPLHDIEIVNHEIKYDIDIQRARRKLSYTMNFEIDGCET